MAYIDICVICKDPHTKNITKAVVLNKETVAICPKCIKKNK